MSKVIIIGAGLAGLALAHALQRYNVPFEIFERDEKTASRKQGWAVALVECLPALEKVLPPPLAKDLYTNSVNHLTGDLDQIGFVDSITGQQVGAVGPAPRGEKGHLLRVSRENFRNFLLNADNISVTMGKRFTHYTEDAGGVTAFFSDGSSVKGSLLVGADGAHSHVLNQLVGSTNHVPELSEQVPIFGEVTLPKALYEPVRKLGNAVVLAGAPQVRLQLGQLYMEKDLSQAFYFWALMLRRPDPKPLNEWLAKATKEEVYEFVLKSTEGLHPSLRDPMVYGGVQSIVKPQPSFLEFVPPNELPPGRVTVIGDAAHAMIPLRGAGANTAILDACDLGELLGAAWGKQADLAGVLDDYYKVMLPRGRENVLSSRAAGQDDENPAEGWSHMFRRPEAGATK